MRYLHLTVREFLEKPAVWARLLSLTAPDQFDANTRLLRAKLLMLKLAPQELKGNPTAATALVNSAMIVALKAESSTGRSEIFLLDELNQTLSELFLNKRTFQHWTTYLRVMSGGNRTDLEPTSFLAYAIQCGLTRYVKSKIDLTGIHEVRKELGRRSALDYATWCNPFREDYTHTLEEEVSQVQPAMIKMLLEAGIDPNKRAYKTTTPWLSLLQFFEDKITKEGRPSQLTQRFDLLWVDIVKLYLLYDADIKAYKSRLVPSRCVWDICRGCFGHLPSEPVLELKRLIDEREVKGVEFTVPRSQDTDSTHLNLGRRESQLKDYKHVSPNRGNHPAHCQSYGSRGRQFHSYLQDQARRTYPNRNDFHSQGLSRRQRDGFDSSHSHRGRNGPRFYADCYRPTIEHTSRNRDERRNPKYDSRWRPY